MSDARSILDGLKAGAPQPEAFTLSTGATVLIKPFTAFEQHQTINREMTDHLELLQVSPVVNVGDEPVTVTKELLSSVSTVMAGCVEPRFTFTEALEMAHFAAGDFIPLARRIMELQAEYIRSRVQGAMEDLKRDPFPGSADEGGAPVEDAPEPGATDAGE